MNANILYLKKLLKATFIVIILLESSDNMKKNGFTLAELLGVIVVLAIISTILTTVIITQIEESKRNSVIRSAESIINNVVLDYTKNDNFTTEKIDITSLDIKGKKPELGHIQFNENEKVRFYMAKDGYCVAKTYDTELVAVKLEDTDLCDWYTSPNTIREEKTEPIFTLNNLKDNKLLNYRIYGNSYQETRSGKNLFNFNSSEILYHNGFGNSPYGTTVKIENGYKATSTTSSDSYRLVVLIPMNLFEVGKSYTISADVSNVNVITVGEANDYGDTSNFYKYKKSWEIPFTFTINEMTKPYLSLYFYANTYAIGDVIEVKNIQIEEGTNATKYEPYGVMPSPEYPSAIQSVGDLVTEEGPNKGKYEIPIKVTGKNLFDANDFIETYSPYFATNKPSVKEVNGEDVLDVWGGVNVDGRNIKYMKGMFKENTRYTFSLGIYDIPSLVNDSLLPGIMFTIVYTDNTSYNLLGRRNDYYNTWREIKFTSSNNKTIDYIAISYYTGGGESYIKDFQIEEGTSTTTYEPYKEKAYSIYLDEPLRCVGEVCDYIDYGNGQVVRKIKSVKLKDRTWHYNSSLGVFSTEYDKISDIVDEPNSTELLSSNYIVRASTSDNSIYINRQKITIWEKDYATLDSFKASVGDGEVYYISTNPQYLNIDLPKIELFETENNLMFSSNGLKPSKIEIITTTKK